MLGLPDATAILVGCYQVASVVEWLQEVQLQTVLVPNKLVPSDTMRVSCWLLLQIITRPSCSPNHLLPTCSMSSLLFIPHLCTVHRIFCWTTRGTPFRGLIVMRAAAIKQRRITCILPQSHGHYIKYKKNIMLAMGSIYHIVWLSD